MNASDTQLSKTLSYFLRHAPQEAGLVLSSAGWVAVDDLLFALVRKGHGVTLADLQRVVATNPKQRFEFSPEGLRLRARQGHSVEVELGYPPAEPPPVLWHGTPKRNRESIEKNGLLKGERHHVHLSTDKPLMIEVARRRGEPALVRVDAAAMHAAGHVFHVTENGVWLTERVPAEFLVFEDEGANVK